MILESSIDIKMMTLKQFGRDLPIIFVYDSYKLDSNGQDLFPSNQIKSDSILVFKYSQELRISTSYRVSYVMKFEFDFNFNQSKDNQSS